MTDQTTPPQRKRLRAQGYDYAQPGWYFVTLCTQHRRCLFGHIDNGLMCHSPVGTMIQSVFEELPLHFVNIAIEPYVVMPNHVHAIIKIDPLNGSNSPHTLSDIVTSFKVQTTHRYAVGVRQSGWKPFPGKLWQRSFHDRIIRNDYEAERLYDYVEANPALWDKDTHYTSP